MSAVEITFVLFGGMAASLAAGVPIAFALGGLSVILVYFLWGPSALSMLVLRAYGQTSSFELTAIPLFIFMAEMLQRSNIAEDMYSTMQHLFRRVQGGLAVGTLIICTIFAAMAGISGAATISMGLIALPAMLRRGYDRRLAVGSIAAGGSLGILIPPSVTMIIYGLVSGTSIGKLYAGGVFPGLLLATIFIVYVLVFSRMKSRDAAAAPPAAPGPMHWTTAAMGLGFPLLIVVMVLGSMFSGLASISESAAVGATTSIVASLVKRRCSWAVLIQASRATLLYSCLIFWIIIGAAALSTFYTAMGASQVIQDLVLGLDVNPYLTLIGMLFILMIMGMFIETTGIIMITVPVMVPIIEALGFDPVWFGVLFIINMEMGFLTPPFGYNLFYLKGVAPPEVGLRDIYLGVFPFILLMIAAIGICVAVPDIILLLPGLLF